MDTAIALTNPGAESGSLTGWTVVSGSPTTSTSSPHSGSRCFSSSASSEFYQLVDVSSFATAIDAGTATAFATAWRRSTGSQSTSYLYVKCYASDGTTLLGTTTIPASSVTVWEQVFLHLTIPTSTRFLRLGTVNSSFFSQSLRWDDFTLTVSDADTARISQAIAYGLVSEPAAQLRANQVAVLSVNAAEESTGQYLMKTHQVVAYALVKGKAERVDLRAWTFLQDDHLFYGLQLGNLGTIVHDVLTRQWCQWYSPGYNYFRAEDVTDWEGYNLACDTENGTIWKIDPTGRLDAGTTAITSTVTGQATVRGRRTIPCYTAELACSQADPSTSGTSIQLRTSDDGGDSWIDHGTVDGEAAGTSTLFRFYGLGVMQAPGRIFEITNAGYAQRIDGLDLEIGGSASDVGAG